MSTDVIAAAERGAPPVADPLQLVVFGLGADDYAVPITLVQEIIRHSPPRPMPGAGPAIEGLINLSGSILPVVDLRCHLPAAGERPAESRIVIRRASGREPDRDRRPARGHGGAARRRRARGADRARRHHRGNPPRRSDHRTTTLSPPS